MSSAFLDIIKVLSIGVVVSVVTAVVTAVVTVKLALRRFYTEKWWERKTQAYSEIIGSLVKMQICYARWEAKELEQRNLSEKAQKRINREYATAKEVLESAVAAGSFLISEKAADVLGSFLKELEKVGSPQYWFEDLERHYGEVIKCIAGMREIAKRELRKR